MSQKNRPAKGLRLTSLGAGGRRPSLDSPAQPSIPSKARKTTLWTNDRQSVIEFPTRRCLASFSKCLPFSTLFSRIDRGRHRVFPLAIQTCWVVCFCCRDDCLALLHLCFPLSTTRRLESTAAARPTDLPSPSPQPPAPTPYCFVSPPVDFTYYPTTINPFPCQSTNHEEGGPRARLGLNRAPACQLPPTPLHLLHLPPLYASVAAAFLALGALVGAAMRSAAGVGSIW